MRDRYKIANCHMFSTLYVYDCTCTYEEDRGHWFIMQGNMIKSFFEVSSLCSWADVEELCLSFNDAMLNVFVSKFNDHD